MICPSPRFLIACVLSFGFATPVQAQVHYHDNDSPWGQRAESGPDADVPGWFYNLGITGLRAQLVADHPKALLIKYVFPDSPAAGRIETGDLLVGAGGQMFQQPHRNGYGERVFGADGPISELARGLEECQGADGIREGLQPLLAVHRLHQRVDPRSGSQGASGGTGRHLLSRRRERHGVLSLSKRCRQVAAIYGRPQPR